MPSEGGTSLPSPGLNAHFFPSETLSTKCKQSKEGVALCLCSASLSRLKMTHRLPFSKLLPIISTFYEADTSRRSIFFLRSFIFKSFTSNIPFVERALLSWQTPKSTLAGALPPLQAPLTLQARQAVRRLAEVGDGAGDKAASFQSQRWAGLSETGFLTSSFSSVWVSLLWVYVTHRGPSLRSLCHRASRSSDL